MPAPPRHTLSRRLPRECRWPTHFLPEVFGQHHLGSLGQEQYRLQTTGGVRRREPCRRAVMRGLTLDDRGAEGPNRFAIVAVDLRFGVEQPGRVLEISLCFLRLFGGVPLEEEVPVILSQLTVSSSGQEVNEPLLVDVFRSCRVLLLHFVEDEDFGELPVSLEVPLVELVLGVECAQGSAANRRQLPEVPRHDHGLPSQRLSRLSRGLAQAAIDPGHLHLTNHGPLVDDDVLDACYPRL